MPRTYDPEFRRRVVELVQAGRPVRVVAAALRHYARDATRLLPLLGLTSP